MRQGQAALWMGISVFVGGGLVFGSAWVGDFSWTRVVFGAIPIALGGLLMLKRA